MTPALTPDLAVGYLRELSADIRAAAVLSPAGEPIAGAPELAGAARELLAAAPDAAEIEVATAGGAVYAARDEQHAVVAVCGRFALPALVRYDLKVVLAELASGGRRDPAGGVMPRLPRRPGARPPRGPVGTVAATLARRRDARAPRIVVRDRTGQPRVLAVERGSRRGGPPERR